MCADIGQLRTCTDALLPSLPLFRPYLGESHRQGLQRAHTKSWPPLGRIARQTEIAEAAQKRAEGDLALHPGQRRADAEVRAVPEAEMGVGMAPNLKPLRIGKLRRVAIGRGEHAHDLLARLDRLAANVEIGCRGPRHEL